MFGPATSTPPSGPRNLIGNPDFRRAFIEASEFVESRRGWSLLRELDNDSPPEGVTSSERNFVQEVVFQLCVFRAFHAANIEFDAVAGVSLGDAAAGHASGALTFEETLHVMCETIRAALCAVGGDLIAVKAPPRRVSEIVDDTSVRMIFDWSVLSVWAVPDESARRMLRRLRAERIVYSRLGFNCLSHTERVDTDGLLKSLSSLPTRKPSCLLYSTLEGGVVRGPTPPERWVRAISEPVQLERMWREMRADRFTDVIYIGSVPADRDLFGGLPREEQPERYCTAESLIRVDRPPEGETRKRIVGAPTDIATVLRSSAFARNPYPYYAEWLRESPVQKLAGEDFFVVTGYDASLDVMKRPEVFSSSPFETLSPVLPGADAPLHTRVRRGLSPFFTRDRVLDRRDRVHALVAGAVNTLKARRTFDACNDFALPLTFGVWCDSLGLHQEQAAAIAPLKPADATWEDVEFALNGDGIMAEVVARDELSGDDIAKLLPFLIGAGTLTMRDTICCALHTLLRKPALVESMAENSALVPGFVEELLRYEPGIHGVPRRARHDTVLAGVEIPENSTLWVLIAAANRDPSKFENPDEFIIGRSGEKHISFGAGPHYCIGSHLGRLEAEMVIEALLPILGRLRATKPPDFSFTNMRDPLQMYPFMRGMRSWQLALNS
jgi:cytochrome P450